MTDRIAAMAFLLLAVAAAGATVADDDLPEAVDTARAPVEDATPRGPSVEERLAVIRHRIQNALVYPPLARWRDLSGETIVRFEIGPEGRARDVQVMRSSGQLLLDEAAARAVVAAGALPRVYGPLEVPVRFELEEGR